MSRKKEFLIKLCISSIMAALFVVFDMLSIKISNNIKITFGGLPILIVAFLLGPLWGALTGFVGAFVGQLLSFGLSVTTLVWVLPAAVRGIVAGYLFILLAKKLKERYGIMISVISSSLLVTVLNTLAIYIDSKVFGYFSLEVVFGATAFRLISAVLTSVAYILLIIPIYKAVKKIMK